MTETDAAPATRPNTLSRRAVVAGAGAAALGATLLAAGCSTGAGSTADQDGSGSGGAAPAGTALGPATDVPVGGAKIYDTQGVVVTQATAGTYAGFSTVCPHQQCNVNQISGTSIICPCHGSTFALDGSRVSGPAPRGLTARAVTVTGDEITLA
jgi:Rieske Fe-S protein